MTLKRALSPSLNLHREAERALTPTGMISLELTTHRHVAKWVLEPVHLPDLG